MKIFLTLKHWQLFLILFGIPIFLQFTFIGSITASKNLTSFFIIFSIIMILYVAVFFGWLYTLGTNLHKLLPESVTMNLTRFKIFLLVPALYICLLCAFVFPTIAAAINSKEVPAMFGWIALIVPVHLFSIFCIIYCLYFNAKALKAVELQRPVTFSDYIAEFLLIWFFFVGVWLIQPRINQLFGQSSELNN